MKTNNIKEYKYRGLPPGLIYVPYELKESVEVVNIKSFRPQKILLGKFKGIK